MHALPHDIDDADEDADDDDGGDGGLPLLLLHALFITTSTGWPVPAPWAQA